MKVVITQTALQHLEHSLELLKNKISSTKRLKIAQEILSKAKTLSINPHKGQEEDYLKHLNKNHRRIIKGYYKIIYRVEKDVVYITDIFDSRQSPSKMKG